MTKIGSAARSLAVAALLLISAIVHAEDPSLELTVDKTALSAGDSISVQVTAHGISDPSQPVLKNTADFDVQALGTSSQIQIINGSYSSSKTFQFLLTPRKTGSFTIGPAEVVAGDKTYQSDTVTLNIDKGAAPPASPGEARNQTAYVVAEASETSPYVNEPVLYTFRFYTRVPVRNAELKPPDFSGFRKEQLGDARHSQQVINGQAWEIDEIRRVLFPVSAGDAQISPMELTADLLLPSREDSLFRRPFFNNDPFFNTMFQQAQRKRFSTDAIPLHVRPLPEAEKPADFAGLVGSSQISAQLSSQDVEAGDSITLTLTVQGNGNVRDVPTPQLDGGSDFKIYDDQPGFKLVPIEKGIKGIKTFKKAIVPLRSGDLRLPAFKISYFDPKTQRYETVSTDPIPIHVRPSTHPVSVNPSTPSPVSKQDVTLLSQDLMPIERSASALKSQSVDSHLRIAFLLLTFVPLIGFAAARQWKRRLDRIRSDSGFLRREKAFKSAHQELRRLPQASDREFPEFAARILRTFIGDKAGIDGGSLTPSDVEPRLEPLGVSAEMREAVRAFLKNCDAALYGGQAVTRETRSRFCEELKSLIERVGKEIRS